MGATIPDRIRGIRIPCRYWDEACTEKGSGHFSGAIAGASFTAPDAIKVHFDEGLALNVGPVLRYAIASYIERPQ